MKRCPDCGEAKSLDDFPRNRRTKDGRGCYCKSCHNARNRRTIATLHGDTRHYHLKQRFGIGAEEFDRLLAVQNGLCACCGEAPGTQVDHDHDTGKVRGILCLPCNAMLGAFRDDERLIYEAVEYIAASRGIPWTGLVKS